ncbi:MAG TPA: hypothetical protein QF564_24985 [Pirellulaceae bacterium]|nr:hypothetical protein [Pirellulaceae bacterium]
MTNDRQAAEDKRRARVKRITSRSRGKVITGTELMRRYALPSSVEEIERGQRGQKRQQPLFDTSGRDTH